MHHCAHANFQASDAYTCNGLLLPKSKLLLFPLLLALVLGSKAWLNEGTGLLLLVQSRASWPVCISSHAHTCVCVCVYDLYVCLFVVHVRCV